MARVLKSDLSGSNINNMITSLEADIVDADNIINALNSFIDESKNELTGASYDAARNKIASYIPILTKRKEIAGSLKSAISYTTSVMSNYMEDFDELDDSNSQNIQTRLNQISEDLNKVYNILKQETGTTGSNYIECINSIARYQSMYNELNKLNEKLINLNQTDSTAYSKMSYVSSAISSYKASVESISITNF